MYSASSSQSILTRVRCRGLGFLSPSMSTKSSDHGAAAHASSVGFPSIVTGEAAR
jgi:hypothetical protein